MGEFQRSIVDAARRRAEAIVAADQARTAAYTRAEEAHARALADADNQHAEVAAEIIRLYHSPAPIRENLALIQRHGLAMAQALVEIDKVTAPYADARCGRTFANTLAERIAAILDGSVAAEETTT